MSDQILFDCVLSDEASGEPDLDPGLLSTEEGQAIVTEDGDYLISEYQASATETPADDAASSPTVRSPLVHPESAATDECIDGHIVSRATTSLYLDSLLSDEAASEDALLVYYVACQDTASDEAYPEDANLHSPISRPDSIASDEASPENAFVRNPIARPEAGTSDETVSDDGNFRSPITRPEAVASDEASPDDAVVVSVVFADAVESDESIPEFFSPVKALRADETPSDEACGEVRLAARVGVEEAPSDEVVSDAAMRVILHCEPGASDEADGETLVWSPISRPAATPSDDGYGDDASVILILAPSETGTDENAATDERLIVRIANAGCGSDEATGGASVNHNVEATSTPADDITSDASVAFAIGAYGAASDEATGGLVVRSPVIRPVALASDEAVGEVVQGMFLNPVATASDEADPPAAIVMCVAGISVVSDENVGATVVKLNQTLNADPTESDAVVGDPIFTSPGPASDEAISSPRVVISLVPGPSNNLRYQCLLTGAAVGLPDLDLSARLSSFQCRKKTGSPSYLSAIIKGVSGVIDAINARNGCDLVISMGYASSGGGSPATYMELMRVTLDMIRTDEGAGSSSVTLDGHKTTTNTNQGTRTISQITSRRVSGGKYAYRCPIRHDVSPGDTVVYEGDSFVVDSIAIAVGATQQSMDISEAA
ncbi:MAG: hypothetical protein HQL74_07270 [Magnetococcales bacterium]|nr:hypothetical protein [Magnetococcales bacterium]